MNSLEQIQSRIRARFESDPRVHVNVSISRPRLTVRGAPAVIKGVYPHVFRLKAGAGGAAKYYTVPYADILTRQVEIVELAAGFV